MPRSAEGRRRNVAPRSLPGGLPRGLPVLRENAPCRTGAERSREARPSPDESRWVLEDVVDILESVWRERGWGFNIHPDGETLCSIMLAYMVWVLGHTAKQSWLMW